MKLVPNGADISGDALSLILGLALLTASTARAEPAFDTLFAALTDKVVVPAYTRLATAMAGLAQATASFYDKPSPAGLFAAKDAFSAAMDAGQQAQPFVLGPVTREGRGLRHAV